MNTRRNRGEMLDVNFGIPFRFLDRVALRKRMAVSYNWKTVGYIVRGKKLFLPRDRNDIPGRLVAEYATEQEAEAAARYLSGGAER